MNEDGLPPKASLGTAEQFLEVASQYQLGELVTEQPHPLTRELSRLACEDLPAAIECLREVDLAALDQLQDKVEARALGPLAREFAATLAAGNRIVLCGCGATGRLSIALEVFGRQGLLGAPTGDRVVGFMAGGDAALVRSIERFEDYPEYGVRQLRELGFRDGDLLVGITEGGETPFVIGATEEAARRSRRPPFFLYCNPDEVLSRVAERSRRVLANPGIRKINLTVGPMAITGSTRMQASTVQMAAVGWALACREEPEAMGTLAREFRDQVRAAPCDFLADFIEREADAYQAAEGVLYEPGEFGLTVLTDTTERAPTFSLPPFENVLHPEESVSACYLHVDGTESAAAAWQVLLGRAPRTLAWGGLEHLTGEAQLLGFDFSDGVVARRSRLAPQHRFECAAEGAGPRLRFGPVAHVVSTGGLDGFGRHLLLKLLLNTHSTLVMGRLGRFEGNVMTHVNATNRKLIDRAIRYARMLLSSRHGFNADYGEVARVLFELREGLRPGEPIVLKTVEAILQTQGD